MSDRPHGEILLTTQGNILIAQYIGMFNLDGMQLGVQAMQTAIAQFAGEPFAMLIDDLQVEGGTPEAYEALEAFNQWLISQNMVAKATVITSKVKLKIIDSLVASRKKQNHQAFTTMSDAISWLTEQLNQAKG